MEKCTPSCKLTVIKLLVEQDKVRATIGALQGAASMGMVFDDMLNVVRSPTDADLYKSMTPHLDHGVWKDVIGQRHLPVRST